MAPINKGAHQARSTCFCQHANGYPKPECPQLPSPGPPGLELWDTEELVPQVLPADDDLFRVRVRVRVRVRALPRLGLGLGLGLGLN